jgi:hypothetical protein
MRTAVFQLQDILATFQKKKVLTKKELLEQAGCSTMTAWRLLRRHGYFTSYNDNARHYTIAGIPEFDEHGLWAFRGARFSKWGSLTRTIVALVENSTSGLTAEQLESTLSVPNVKPVLCRLIDQRLIAREKIGGPFVYFSLQQKHRAKQHQQRRQDLHQATAERRLPPLDQIIALLVEIIRRPRGTPRDWARQLGRRGVRMKTEDIQVVLAHYDIDPKKGLSKS